MDPTIDSNKNQNGDKNVESTSEEASVVSLPVSSSQEFPISGQLAHDVDVHDEDATIVPFPQEKEEGLKVRAFAFVRSFLSVAGWTGVSRISGVIREMLFANLFGASVFSDIYAYSLKLPSFFRRFFAEGALSAVLVPRFSSLISQNKEDQFRSFAQQILSVLIISLSLFVLLFEIGMPSVIDVIAPGFKDNDFVRSNVIHFARLMFPYILLISIVAMMSGMLNSMNHFAWPAAISVVLNGCMILMLVIGKMLGDHASLNLVMHMLGTIVLAAGVLQCAILWLDCKKNGLTLYWVRPRLSPKIRSVLKATVPGMIGASVMQINVFVDMAFASLLPSGSVSYLHYADRLNQLPLSLLGAALGTTLLPPLSKYWKNNEIELAHQTQNRAISFGMVFVLPAAVGLFVAAGPIVNLLYGHGRFDTFAIEQTMLALKAFVIGLPTYVLTKVFSAVFFAHRDTKTPVIIAAIAVGLNACLNFILIKIFAHVGIAMATAVSSIVNALLGGVILYRRGLFTLTRVTAICMIKALAASLVMGGAVNLLFDRIDMTTIQSVWIKIGMTIVPITLGMGIYIALAFIFKMQKSLSWKAK